MIYFSLNIILQGHRTTGIEFIAIIIAVILVFIQAAIKGEKRVKEDKEYCRKKGIDYNEFLSIRNDKSAKNRARRIPKSTRNYVLSRDGYQCQYCGSTEDLHIDHIYPFSRGGPSTKENLQVLCASCNLEKSDRVPKQ